VEHSGLKKAIPASLPEKGTWIRELLKQIKKWEKRRLAPQKKADLKSAWTKKESVLVRDSGKEQKSGS